ncbi:MAG: hypothetical protein WAM13_06060, partial [Candidatus Sulfotelmatobacter sp.]
MPDVDGAAGVCPAGAPLPEEPLAGVVAGAFVAAGCPDDPVPAEVVEGEVLEGGAVEAGALPADPELGLDGAAGCDDFSRVRRGGASLSPLFSPTGT